MRGDEPYLTDRPDQPSRFLSLSKRHGGTSPETDEALRKVFGTPKAESTESFGSALRKLAPQQGLPSASLRQSAPVNDAAAMIAPTMAAAVTLYESLGFRETSPYYDSPIPGTRFMILRLL